MRSARRRRLRALRRLPAMLAGALVLPFRRVRRSQGIAGDADARRNEMLALSGGVARTVAGARLRGLLRGKKRRAQLRQEALDRATALAVEQLGAMKGVSMKVGQMLSYLSVLSEEGEEGLADLQAAVPAMEPSLVEAVVEEELGEPISHAFADFEETPIAAASVGQVHRARLHDGRAVAVKVQYPGVADAFRADLDNLQSLVPMAGLTMNADVTEYVTMLSDALMGELDYRAEQRNQQRLADMYRDHPFVVLPDTVPELCTSKVLVSSFVDGDRFQVAAASRDQAERNRLGEIMYRFAFGCVMNGFFSGDPHPGNYLFPSDGRVCFLDFGMVMDISGSDHGSKVVQIVRGALESRQDLIDDGLRVLGFLPDGGPSGVDVWRELQGLVVGPIDEHGVTRLDRRAFRRVMLRMTDPRSATNRASMKTDRFEGWAAIWMRYSAGALAAIAKLAPEVDFRQVAAEIVLGAPPATPIGEAWGDAPGGASFARY